MSNRNLGILAVVAAVMVIWAVLQSHLSRPSRVVSSEPTDLIQGLDTGAIDSIVVGHGDEAVTIAKRNGKFVVVDKANYPAAPQRINSLIAECLDVKRSQRYTSNARNHEDLEVTPETAQAQVRFFKPDGTLLTGLVVGKSPESGAGAFVRLADSNDVYVSDSVPWFSTSPLEYIDTELLAVSAEDVNSVTVSTPEGAYTLRPGAGGAGAVMENLPAGKTLKTADARVVLGALSSLRFVDVNTPATLGDLEFDHAYVCLLDDLTRYTLSLAERDGKTYVKADAAYTDTTPVTITQGGSEPEEELRKKEARLLANERAQTFAMRHKGWIYEISASAAGDLMTPQADLLEDTPEPATDDLLEDVVPLPEEASDSNTAAIPVPMEQPEPVAGPNQATDPNA